MLTCHLLKRLRRRTKYHSSICQKPTFSGVYTYFDLDAYKIGMIYRLVEKYFRIGSKWTMFHSHLILLRETFQKMVIQKTSLIDVLGCL